MADDTITTATEETPEVIPHYWEYGNITLYSQKNPVAAYTEEQYIPIIIQRVTVGGSIIHGYTNMVKEASSGIVYGSATKQIKPITITASVMGKENVNAITKMLQRGLMASECIRTGKKVNIVFTEYKIIDAMITGARVAYDEGVPSASVMLMVSQYDTFIKNTAPLSKLMSEDINQYSTDGVADAVVGGYGIARGIADNEMLVTSASLSFSENCKTIDRNNELTAYPPYPVMISIQLEVPKVAGYKTNAPIPKTAVIAPQSIDSVLKSIEESAETKTPIMISMPYGNLINMYISDYGCTHEQYAQRQVTIEGHVIGDIT